MQRQIEAAAAAAAPRRRRRRVHVLEAADKYALLNCKLMINTRAVQSTHSLTHSLTTVYSTVLIERCRAVPCSTVQYVCCRAEVRARAIENESIGRQQMRAEPNEWPVSREIKMRARRRRRSARHHSIPFLSISNSLDRVCARFCSSRCFATGSQCSVPNSAALRRPLRCPPADEKRWIRRRRRRTRDAHCTRVASRQHSVY